MFGNLWMLVAAKIAIHLRIDLTADVFVAFLALRDQDGPVRQTNTRETLFRWSGTRDHDWRHRDERKRRGTAIAGRSAATGGSLRHGQDQGHPGHCGELATPEDARAEAVGPQIARMHPLAATHIERSITQSGELRRIKKSKLEWQNSCILQRSGEGVLAGYKVERTGSRGLR